MSATSGGRGSRPAQSFNCVVHPSGSFPSTVITTSVPAPLADDAEGEAEGSAISSFGSVISASAVRTAARSASLPPATTILSVFRRMMLRLMSSCVVIVCEQQSTSASHLYPRLRSAERSINSTISLLLPLRSISNRHRRQPLDRWCSTASMVHVIDQLTNHLHLRCV